MYISISKINVSCVALICINLVASRVFWRPAFFILGPPTTDHQAEALLMISYKIHLSSQLVSPTLKSFPGLDKVPCSRCSWSNPPKWLIHFHSTDTLGSHCLRAGFSLTWSTRKWFVMMPRQDKDKVWSYMRCRRTCGRTWSCRGRSRAPQRRWQAHRKHRPREVRKPPVFEIFLFGIILLYLEFKVIYLMIWDDFRGVFCC